MIFLYKKEGKSYEKEIHCYGDGSSAFFASTPFASFTQSIAAESVAAATTADLTADGFAYSVKTDGTIEISEYKGSDTTVTVPSQIDGGKVTSIGSYAFYNCTSLVQINLPDSIAAMGECAFSGCSSLTSITIPKSLTILGERVFCGCSSLTSIDIPENVETIYDSALGYCTALETVTLHSGLKRIDMMAFIECSSLTEITIPDSVTDIGVNAFLDCSSMEVVECAKENEAYTSESGVLYDKNKTTLIYYPDAKKGSAFKIPYGVTAIKDRAFESNPYITEITIPSTVTTIGTNAFHQCSSLSTVVIASSVTDIGENAFDGCPSDLTIYCSTGSYAYDFAHDNKIGINTTTLHKSNGFTYTILDDETAEITGYTGSYGDGTISIPEQLDGLRVISIGEYSFAGCDKLTAVNIPEGVTAVGAYAFNECTALTTVTLPDSVTNISDFAFYGCCSLKSIDIPTRVKSIGSEAFSDCTALTSITLPENVETMEAYVFRGCTSLKAIYCADGNNYYSAENGILYNKEKTTLICYPAAKETSAFKIPCTVSEISSYAFGSNSYLTEITVSINVTTIGDYAFYNCSNLKNVIIMHFSNPTAIGTGILTGCDSPTVYCDSTTTAYTYAKDNGYAVKTDFPHTSGDFSYVILEDGIAEITGYSGSFEGTVVIPSEIDGLQVTSIETAFRYCTELTAVSIPEGITTIGMGAFAYCEALSEVNLPSSVTSIEESAFGYCKSLTEITIPEGVTTIGAWAFLGCWSLTEITILGRVTTIETWTFLCCEKLTTINLPVGLTNIEMEAFAWCESLTEITIPNSVTDIGAGAFSDCTALEKIAIPDSVTSIGKNVLEGCESPTIYCAEDSVAYQYAIENGINYVIDNSLKASDDSVNTDDKENTEDNKQITDDNTNAGSENPGEETAPAPGDDGDATNENAGGPGTDIGTNPGTGGDATNDSAGDHTIVDTAAAAVKSYTITYKLNKGTNNSQNPSTYSTESVTLKNPTRAGYVFKGWYTDSKYKTKITTIKKGAAKDYTLYAKWVKVSVKKTAISSVTNKKGKKIVVKYKKVSGAKGYVITCATDKKFTKSVKTVTTAKTTAALKKLKKGTTYYVRVQAYKLDSTGKKVYGKVSAVKKVTVKK